MSDWESLTDLQKKMCMNARREGIIVIHTLGGIIVKDGINGYQSDVESAEAVDAIEVLEHLGFIRCDGRDKRGRKSHFILTHYAHQTLTEQMLEQAGLDASLE